MTDNTNAGQLTVDDIINEAEQAPYHTIAELWSKVLVPARHEQHARVTPQLATRLVQTYAEVTYAQTAKYMPLFHEKVIGLLEILENTLDEAAHDEALNVTSAEEDAAQNRQMYIQIITDWQEQMLRWEMEWTPDTPDAGLKVAILSEVHKMFFEQNGIISLLDHINFEFTDDDRTRLTENLEAVRKEVEGE